MADIRLIVMDMDGTLLNSRDEISPQNVRAIRDAEKHGIRTAIGSGRNPADLYMFLKEYGLGNMALLSLNGTYCVRSFGEEPFLSCMFSEDSLRSVETILRQENVDYECYCERQIAVYHAEGREVHKPWVKYMDVGIESLSTKLTDTEEGLRQARKQGVHKVITEFESEESCERTRLRLEELGMLEIASSWHRNLELMPLGHGKGEAILAYAAVLGITREQVMAIGDYDNDLSMIRAAGLGIAMKNSSPAVLEAADAVTLTNNEDGVAYAIRRYALQETEEYPAK